MMAHPIQTKIQILLLQTLEVEAPAPTGPGSLGPLRFISTHPMLFPQRGSLLRPVYTSFPFRKTILPRYPHVSLPHYIKLLTILHYPKHCPVRSFSFPIFYFLGHFSPPGSECGSPVFSTRCRPGRPGSGSFCPLQYPQHLGRHLATGICFTCVEGTIKRNISCISFTLIFETTCA